MTADARDYVFTCDECGKVVYAVKEPEGDFFCSTECFVDALLEEQ